MTARDALRLALRVALLVGANVALAYACAALS